MTISDPAAYAGLTPPAALVSTIVVAPGRPINSFRLDHTQRRQAFVHVQPALEADDRDARHAPEQQAAGMSGCGGRRPTRQIREVDRHRFFDRVRNAAQSGAEDQADARHQIRVDADRALQLIEASPQ